MWRLSLFLFRIFFGFLGIFFSAYVATRLVIILNDISKKRKSAKFTMKRRKHAVKTMIIAGSGGHTAEMLRLVEWLGPTYTPRQYVVANTDTMSAQKIQDLEEKRAAKGDNGKTDYTVSQIPRSREVKQSWLTTVISTIYACLYAFPLVGKSRPDLVLCNGPGTCIPICAAAFLLTVLGIKRVSIIFVESICRVESLSLSGRILYYFADQIIVQWPELRDKYPLTRYIGRLV